MAKISINCGQCAVKDCTVKKQFKQLAKVNFPDKFKDKNSTSTFSQDLVFKLKCPLKEYKHKSGDIVLFKIGIGRHEVEQIFECPQSQYCDDNYDDLKCTDCDLASFCDDGMVTKNSIRIKEYIEIKGHVYDFYKGNLFIIYANFSTIKDKFTKFDLEYYENKKLDNENCFYSFVKTTKMTNTNINEEDKMFDIYLNF
jgi:hypothetical protein